MLHARWIERVEDRILPMRDTRDLEYGLLPHDVVGAREIKKRAFIDFLGQESPLDHDLRIGRNLHVDRLALDHLKWNQGVGDRQLVDAFCRARRGGDHDLWRVPDGYGFLERAIFLVQCRDSDLPSN